MWNIPPLFKQIFQGNMQKGEENSNPTMKPNTIINSRNCSLSVCNIIIVCITLRCITVIGSFHLQIHLVCYGRGSATILCISLLSHQTIKCSNLFFKMLCIFWLFSRNQGRTYCNSDQLHHTVCKQLLVSLNYNSSKNIGHSWIKMSGPNSDIYLVLKNNWDRAGT